MSDPQNAQYVMSQGGWPRGGPVCAMAGPAVVIGPGPEDGSVATSGGWPGALRRAAHSRRCSACAFCSCLACSSRRSLTLSARSARGTLSALVGWEAWSMAEMLMPRTPARSSAIPGEMVRVWAAK